MARPNPIRRLMSEPLPPKTAQRRLPYRPKLEEVEYTYQILNKYVFDNALKKPPIRQGILQNAWGICCGLEHPKEGYRSYCEIKISDKWYCVQWMISTLAHEMCHQYQWDIYGPERAEMGKDWLMSHGPTFLEHRDRLQEYGIPLKVSFSRRRWFAYQDLFSS
jgi:hypothetical protein